MISKKEAIGIFISIAIMALGLAFFRFDGFGVVARLGGGVNEQGAVVVSSGNGESEDSARTAAIKEAANITGKLEKLVIDDIRLGTGDRVVQEGDTVTVNYMGATQSGVQFDNSYERGEPFPFTVGEGRVIEGWEKGLIGMKVGGQRILVVPPAMAYGNAQVGPIAPNSILVFTVELVSIK